MGIAFTILIAGIVVQSTDTLELFGRDSVVPLIIGLVIIVIGVAIFPHQAVEGQTSIEAGVPPVVFCYKFISMLPLPY